MSTKTDDSIKFNITDQKGLNPVINSEKEYVSIYYSPYSYDKKVKTEDCYYIKYIDKFIKL